MFKDFSIKLALILSVILMSNTAVYSLTPTEIGDEAYLKSHGHSQEVVNIVNMQRSRQEGIEVPVVDTRYKVGRWLLPTTYSNFLRNIIYKHDATLPLTEIGHPDN